MWPMTWNGGNSWGRVHEGRATTGGLPLRDYGRRFGMLPQGLYDVPEELQGADGFRSALSAVQWSSGGFETRLYATDHGACRGAASDRKALTCHSCESRNPGVQAAFEGMPHGLDESSPYRGSFRVRSTTGRAEGRSPSALLIIPLFQWGIQGVWPRGNDK